MIKTRGRLKTSCVTNTYCPTLPDAYLSPKFLEQLDISELAKAAHRLIEFGILFGTSRLHLTRPSNLAARKSIPEAMGFSNDILLRIADGISVELGGSAGYVAVRLRV